MLAAQHIPSRLLRDQPTLPDLMRIALDSLVVISMLLLSTLAFAVPFDGRHLLLVIVVFALTFPGIPRDRARLRELVRSVLAQWLVVCALLLMLGWATQTLGIFDQRVLAAWLISTPVALIGAHRMLPAVLSRLLSAHGLQRTAVIAGAEELGRRLVARIRAAELPAIRVEGYFDDRGAGRRGEVPATELLGTLDQLAPYVKSRHIDLIYITLPLVSQPRILKLLDELRETTASIYFAPDIFVSDLIQARVGAVGEIPVLAVCETPFRGVDGLIKRASDIVLALFILTLISPVMAAIALGVKLSSPGPVMFKQRRYGLDGREIVVYKFRSMTVLEDGGEVRQAVRNDSRVTRFGAFLRRYSLDELPQFINVLQGRMSVVGPRPHAVAHNEMYRKLIKGYMIRHKVKPGITGWAQVNGLRGETATLGRMAARIEYDLAYLRHWSLRFDLEIVMKTMFVVFIKPDAY
jgi:putative colanic acid biosynthesis UDP-glucose lipid carrier transferase